MSARIANRFSFKKLLREPPTAAIILSTLLGFTAQHSEADAIADAELLLRVSDTARHFQFAADKQTSDLLRVYSSIVAMSADVDLPAHVTAAIQQCYAHTYAWDNFSQGIAEILAQHLSTRELRLLTDFYRSRGLSPMDIDSFKVVISKAPGIEEQTAEYIFLSSSACVDKAASIISRYVNSVALNNSADATE